MPRTISGRSIRCARANHALYMYWGNHAWIASKLQSENKICTKLCAQILHNCLQACYKYCLFFQPFGRLLEVFRLHGIRAVRNHPKRIRYLRGWPTYEQETDVLQDKGHDEGRQEVREPPESHFDMVLKVGLQYWIRPLVLTSEAV
jgi:hypothetical protein